MGGGWEIPTDGKSASHVTLTYMIREAQRAGLNFDPEKLAEMGVTEATETTDASNSHVEYSNGALPDIRINKSSPTLQASPNLGVEPTDWRHVNYTEDKKTEQSNRPFHRMLHKAHLARIHDSLEYGSGLTRGQVLSWKISMS